MDSVTQFTLGAAIGQVILGPKLGRKAALIGGFVATIPDLDGLFLQSLDTVSQLVYHRGFTHSIVFCLCGGALGAWLSQRFSKHLKSFYTWLVFWVLTFFTHTILDCFTSWGTQLFWPFSYRVALQSVFIIDPFYTVPLLIGVIWTALNRRLKPVAWGLVISSVYLLWTLLGHQIANTQFDKGLKSQGLDIKRYTSHPTPFNSILWAITAESEDAYYYSYYSLFDKSYPKHFIQSKPKNHDALTPYLHDKQLQKLLFFTKYFYIVEKVKIQGKEIFQIYDTRYGPFGAWDQEQGLKYTFTYVFDPSDHTIQHIRPKVDNMGQVFKSLLDRVIDSK